MSPGRPPIDKTEQRVLALRRLRQAAYELRCAAGYLGNVDTLAAARAPLLEQQILALARDFEELPK